MTTYALTPTDPFPTKLQPNDVIDLSPGIHFKPQSLPIAGTPDSPIIIRGQAGTICDGSIFGNFGGTPRAFWQVNDGAYRFESMDVRNVSNGGTNAAGIRTVKGNVQINKVRIRNCDMGVHSTDPEVLAIYNSDIQWNGRGANSHNIYSSGGELFVLEDSIIAYTLGGMNVKIRARTPYVRRNRIWYSKDGELQATYQENLVNGVMTSLLNGPGNDCYVEGNDFRTFADHWRSNKTRVCAFGNEGDPLKDRNGTLRLRYNTFTIAKNDQVIASLDSVNAGLELVGNLITGTQLLYRVRYATCGPILITPTTYQPLPTDTTKPQKPTNLTARQTQTAIILDWMPVSGAIDHYEVIAPYGPFSLGLETSYTCVAGLYAGRPYTFAVQAVTTSGVKSDPSDPVTIVRA